MISIPILNSFGLINIYMYINIYICIHIILIKSGGQGAERY